MTEKVSIIVQPNLDSNIQYLQYNYKGSKINVRYFYDNNGHLIRMDIPIFLNLTHWEILELINMLYLQHLTIIKKISLNPQSGISLNGVTTVLGFGGLPFKTTKIATSIVFSPQSDLKLPCHIITTLTTGVA